MSLIYPFDLFDDNQIESMIEREKITDLVVSEIYAFPQLMKRLFRTAKPLVMIPACFLGGSVFCLFCDLLARFLFAPTELSISSVTAVFGAPVVIWVLLTHRKGAER